MEKNFHKTKTAQHSQELIRQAAYFSSAQLIRNLLDAMPGLVLILNRHRQIVFANQAFCDLSGYSDSQILLGRLVGEVMACHIANEVNTACGLGDSCETCGALTALLSGLSGETNVQECVITSKKDQGSHNLTLRIWSAPLRYADEDFTVLAGIDISHERRRLALERTFFHDILNLVGSIRGFAELLEIDDEVNPLEVSQRIQIASQRAIEEIDAQRVLLAAEKGELNVESHALNTLGIINDVITLYEGQEISRNRYLIIDHHSEEALFRSDPILLRRILGNMLKNALEASPKGEKVTVGVNLNGAKAHFWVQNSSVIPREYQKRIFQRDFSTKGPGRG
jgi:nitrogen-specific signal transduction histidine kinase